MRLPLRVPVVFLLVLVAILCWYYNGRSVEGDDSVEAKKHGHRHRSQAGSQQPALVSLRKKQSSPSPTRMIVAARYIEPTTWLDTYFGDIPHTVVQQGERAWATHATRENAGREAGAFLWWIAEFYDALPDVITFVHAHRRTTQHTTDCDIVPFLKSLRWEVVDDCYIFARDSLAMKGTDRFGVLARYWPAIFDPWLGPLPDVIHYFPNAQFAVHKRRILQYPKLFWQIAYNFSMTSFGETPAERDESNQIMGYVWESVWGIVLSKHGKDHGKTAEVEDGPFCGVLHPDMFAPVVAKFHDCALYMEMVATFRSCDYMLKRGLENE
jgi:hypothetical protein